MTLSRDIHSRRFGSIDYKFVSNLSHRSRGLENGISPKSFFDGYTLSAPFTAEVNVKNVIGQTTADGTATLSGVVDEIDPTGATGPKLAQPLTATYSNPVTDGRGALTATGTVPSGFPTNSIFYIVSPSSVRIVSVDTTDTNPQLILLDH